MPTAAAHGIDGFKASSRNQPGSRVGRHAFAAPLADRGGESLVHRLFSHIEIAQQSYERCKDLPGLLAVDAFHLSRDVNIAQSHTVLPNLEVQSVYCRQTTDRTEN